MELKIHDFENGNRSAACIIRFPSHAAYEMPSFSESAEGKLTIFANLTPSHPLLVPSSIPLTSSPTLTVNNRTNRRSNSRVLPSKTFEKRSEEGRRRNPTERRGQPRNIPSNISKRVGGEGESLKRGKLESRKIPRFENLVSRRK